MRQWETSPYATAAPDGGRATLRPRCTPRSPTPRPRLAEARDSDLARLMEQSFQYSMEGRDLLLELRQDAEAALGAARARFAALDV